MLHNLCASASWFFSYRGILRKFPVDEAKIPVDALRRAVARHPDAIDAISPQKMEELVGAVMTGFWPGSKCKHCGKSGDGGIDLLLVIGDKPFAVQVKHRQNPNRGESVHYVTHFIGALMLQDIPNGIFVTSADHFSGAAEKAAVTILKRGVR
jgi:restriction system protein